jgi:iron complex outermembrane receptor protein
VYLGGARINDDVGGTADLSLVPLALIRRVEIYRGNAPLEADRAGIGGAIFFDPRRPRDVRPATGLTLGSFGHRSAWAHAGVGSDASSAALSVRHEDVDNDYEYVDDGGTRFVTVNERTVRRRNADVQTTDAWVLGSTRIRQGRLDLLFNGVTRAQGLAGLGVLPTNRASALQTRELASVSLTTQCPLERCEVTTTTTGLFSRMETRDPLREIGLASTRIETSASRIDESILLRLGLGSRLALGSSLRAAAERLAIDSEQSRGRRARRLTTGAGLLLAWTVLDNLTLRALSTFTCDRTESDAPELAVTASRLCDALTPSMRVGAELGSGRAKLLANVARYGRVPTLGERYGTSPSVRGSDLLRSEVADSAEIGIRIVAGTIQLDVFAFARGARDLISYVRTAPGYIVPYNVGRASLGGVEAALAFTPFRFVRVDVAASVLDARDTSPERRTRNEVVPFRSRLTVAPRFMFLANGWHAAGIGRSFVAVGYLYQSNRYADPAGLVVIPEQGTMEIETAVDSVSERVVIRGRIANVLDQERFDLVGFPLPGRALYGSLEVRW